MATVSQSLNEALLIHWNALEHQSSNAAIAKAIDGHNLDVATVVLVARYNLCPEVSRAAYQAIKRSAEALEVKTASDEVIYGINTGFGGSADTRTKAVDDLKKDLLSGLQYGIISEASPATSFSSPARGRCNPFPSDLSQSLDHHIKTIMPDSWVRASILVRLNTLAHGASGVLPSTVDALLNLLRKNVIPRIPLRGSISASGDLSPLAYIAGVLEGKPALNAYVGGPTIEQRRLVRADIALAKQGLFPVELKAREGLALVNGTSISAAVAALATHEALCLAALSQVLTAMSVEALRGTDESFDPFLARVRPHSGQAESARNIYGFLEDSELVYRDQGVSDSALRQDRYSIRTASQWLGPAMEDLILAHSQVLTELNSATDNPLIDSSVDPPRVIHGGNFQAKSVTSAVEKIRQSAQSIGRLLFTQCTELINPGTSRGLPPNLVASEPSKSFIFKGTDILIASLLSELGFLSNPVASHVQTAEMSNQSLNSLALISARYTVEALEILAQLAAAHLVAVCQALDLRALQARFLSSLKPHFHRSFKDLLQEQLANPRNSESLSNASWDTFTSRLDATTSLDAAVRIQGAISNLGALIMPKLKPRGGAYRTLMTWTDRLGKDAVDLFLVTRESYMTKPDPTTLLGRASTKMYKYIRGQLQIPFVGIETLATREPGTNSSDRGITMGDLNGKVKAAMATGELYKVVVDCIKDANRGAQRSAKALAKL